MYFTFKLVQFSHLTIYNFLLNTSKSEWIEDFCSFRLSHGFP